MGFSGMMVFGRSDGPLTDAPVFRALTQGDYVCTWWPRPGGWQTVQVAGDYWDDVELRRLVEWTGAGACIGWVFDSDVALVVGRGRDGREWQSALNLAVAADMGAPVPADIPGVAREALAWAQAEGAGHGVGADAVEAALRADADPFAEELLPDLLDALGFPPAVEPAEPEEPAES